MEKEFVPYELALRMKQLGFDEPCWCYFMNNVFNSSMFPKDYEYFEVMSKKHTTYTLAPTFSQAFRWFRENYALESYIRANLCVDVPKTYQFNIDDNIDGVWYDTYEEAEIACLEKLIEIVEGIEK
jgi:hypothetical protein